VKQEPIAIEGVWLQTQGNTLVVLVQIEGAWRVVIREYAPLPEMSISHEVTPTGIRHSPTLPEDWRHA
jgi:hypothetical protein